MLKRIKYFFSVVGPGIAVAATGVGAGDMVAAAVSGSRYGYAIVWAAVVGAILKFSLNEGLARWQLATDTALLEGWVTHLGKWVQFYFLVYLVLWSFIVGGALISACGIGAFALMPFLSSKTWAVLHSLGCAAFVLWGHYTRFEQLMKVLIAIMFVAIIGCQVWISPPLETLSLTLQEAAIPAGGAKFILGVIGGVGGSLTLLSYGYWMRERSWKGESFLRIVRVDLGIAYLLTALFGLAIVVLAARVLHAEGVTVEGSSGVIQMARMLESNLGRFGYWTFVAGFWAAVTTSMMGVWQSIPYLFCDFMALLKQAKDRSQMVSTSSGYYRGFLAYLSLAPLSLLYLNKPVFIIVIYSIVGALFMPFLAGTLVILNNNRAWVGEKFVNGAVTNLILILCLLLFSYLCLIGVIEALEMLV